MNIVTNCSLLLLGIVTCGDVHELFYFLEPVIKYYFLFSCPALQVQVIRVTVQQSSTEAELKCHSSCSPAGGLSYVWFKNREHITSVETSTYTTWFNPTDVFSCGLKGHEKFPSPSVCEFTVSGHKHTDITIQ